MIIRARDNGLEIAAPAKVNFHLELLSRRDDGFHEIETVMSAISIFDRLRFELRADSEISLSIQHASRGRQPRESDSIPTDDRNLIVRAIQLVRKHALQTSSAANCDAGMDVVMQKQIPSAAGLGGASGNAAAAIVAANRLWKLNLPLKQQVEIAAELGSDIPFFLTGGTAICRGRGEKVNTIACPTGLALVVVKPATSLSTAEVFRQVKIATHKRDSSELANTMQCGEISRIGSAMFNRLEEFASPMVDEIDVMRKEFRAAGSFGHQISGSGSSYFGLFPTPRVARLAHRRLSSRLPNVRIFNCQTLSPCHISSSSLAG